MQISSRHILLCCVVAIAGCTDSVPKCGDTAVIEILKQGAANPGNNLSASIAEAYEGYLRISEISTSSYDPKLDRYTCSANVGFAEQARKILEEEKILMKGQPLLVRTAYEVGRNEDPGHKKEWRILYSPQDFMFLQMYLSAVRDLEVAASDKAARAEPRPWVNRLKSSPEHEE